jgi:hypothetical protein
MLPTRRVALAALRILFNATAALSGARLLCALFR